MKYYSIQYPTENGSAEDILSEDQVFQQYWNYWEAMMKRVKKPRAAITKENCLSDFIIVHGAETITEDEAHERRLRTKETS